LKNKLFENMDNDILQDNNGNVVTPDNNEVLDNEVEGGVSSETVSPGTGSGIPGIGDIDPVGPTGWQPEPNPPWQPPGTDPEEPEEPGSGSGTGIVLDPGQKIPTNKEIQVAINKKAVNGPALNNYDYYNWPAANPTQTANYCPTRGQIQENISKSKYSSKVLYTTNNDMPGNQCPTADELVAIQINGTPIDRPEYIPDV
jgi:hypothetical protein